jgi:hypothetical protein
VHQRTLARRWIASTTGRAARALAVAGLIAPFLAAPASALPPPPAPPAPALDAAPAPDAPGLRDRLTARLPGCGCASDEELLLRRDRIAAAPDVETAREWALEDVGLARKALGAARRVAPFSDDLAAAHERLERYEDDVSRADSVESVTLRFEDLVQVASADGVIGVDGDYDGGDHGSRIGCSFSTGELIAIILGFILGIIPGLILLVLLC